MYNARHRWQRHSVRLSFLHTMLGTNPPQELDHYLWIGNLEKVKEKLKERKEYKKNWFQQSHPFH